VCGVLFVVVILGELALILRQRWTISQLCHWATQEWRGGWMVPFGIGILVAHLLFSTTIAMTALKFVLLGLALGLALLDYALATFCLKFRRWTLSDWFLRMRARSPYWNALPLVLGLIVGVAAW
jgi:hypothetical protein